MATQKIYFSKDIKGDGRGGYFRIKVERIKKERGGEAKKSPGQQGRFFLEF